MAVEPQTLRGEHRPLRRVAEAFNEDAFLFVPVSFVRRLIEHRTLLVRVGRTWRYGTEGLTDQFDVGGLSATLNRLSCQNEPYRDRRRPNSLNQATAACS